MTPWTQAVISSAPAHLSTDTTQPRRQPASLPSPPPPHLLSCLSAPLLLLPLPPCFKHWAASPPPPPLSLFFLFSFFFSRQHPQSPCPSPLWASIPMNAQSPPFSRGGLWGEGGATAPGLRRGREESSSTHAHTNSITIPPTPPLCMSVCVHICRGTHGGGIFGWRPNGSLCRKWLVATQTAPESTVITGQIPIFYLQNTHVHPQLGQVAPPQLMTMQN